MEDLSTSRSGTIFFNKSKRQNKTKENHPRFLKLTQFSISWGIYVAGRNHKIKSKIAPMCCPKANSKHLFIQHSILSNSEHQTDLSCIFSHMTSARQERCPGSMTTAHKCKLRKPNHNNIMTPALCAQGQRGKSKMIIYLLQNFI